MATLNAYTSYISVVAVTLELIVKFYFWCAKMVETRLQN